MKPPHLIAIWLSLMCSGVSFAQTNTNTSALVTNLVDVLTYVEKFSKSLSLDIPQPLTTNAVKRFRPYQGFGYIGVGLTNGMDFAFEVKHNLITSFWDGKHACDDLPVETRRRLRNASTISEDEALKLARDYLTRLGYSEGKATVLPPRITQSKWLKEGDSQDPLPFFTIEWPWKLHPEAEYFSIEIDGVRLKVNKFHTMKGSFAEDTVKPAESP